MSPDQPLRAALLSMHTDPASTLGGDVTGGMNVYVREVAKALPALGVEADVYTRAESGELPVAEELAPGAYLVRIPAGPLESLDKNLQLQFTEAFAPSTWQTSVSSPAWLAMMVATPVYANVFSIFTNAD